MAEVIVHPRVCKRHPELSEEEVLAAWSNRFALAMRLDRRPGECIAIGVDGGGRMVEMVACRSFDGEWLIYHAMTPPTRKALRELGIGGM